jgi:hypothetical protein
MDDEGDWQSKSGFGAGQILKGLLSLRIQMGLLWAELGR